MMHPFDPLNRSKPEAVGVPLETLLTTAYRSTVRGRPVALG